MNTNINQFISTGMLSWLPAAGFLFIVALVWTFFWKGLALWHSSRRGSPAWFLAFLLLNTVGILEIVYLFGIIKLKINELFSK